MRSLISKMIKRDGSIASFDQSKITNAIEQAFRATGERDGKKAKMLSDEVVKIINKKSSKKKMPKVEEVQDIVEKVLIDNDYARVAKAYILYRQKRAEIRLEKMRILEKSSIDEVDKQFDVNALRVLKARYLRKDETGKLIETPKQLFTRIAIHVAIPDLFYDSIIFDKNGKSTKHANEKFDAADFDNKVSIGKYKLNKYHLEAFKKLYDRLDKDKKMKVSWKKIFEMVKSGKFDKYEKHVDKYYKIMVSRRFMPNTPAIANFGNPLGQGSACFVLGIEDSIDSIMDTLKKASIIFKAGGGVGYNFSNIRPAGDFVKSTHGTASGPVSFMQLYDSMTEVIKQGSIRRGANMGILNINHPDIEKFITTKKGNKALRNFNISVLIFPEFWDYLQKGKPYPLINPKNKKIVKYVNPKELFDRICYQSWESAEPGLVFFDNVNKYNPFAKSLGPIFSTNPCGEVLLYPNESCNLGSINVWAFAKENSNGKKFVDWDELKDAVVICTRFLDNIIDVNRYPLPDIEEMTLNTRKIGLGVMGLADLMFELGLKYNSETGRKLMEKLMEFINYYSKVESIELAKERGSVPYYSKSFYTEGKLPFAGFYDKKAWHFNWKEISDKVRKFGIRNGFTTVIAPTGSISMIAGCSSGMEPIFSLVFEKNVKIGNFYYIDSVFEKAMREEGLYDEELIKAINDNNGSIQNIKYVPKKLKKLFVTAMDMKPEDHIRSLAAFQKWIDSSVSKTNNFPAEATVEDMKKSYLLAHHLDCKDVTVFRDTSIKKQVLSVPKKDKEDKKATDLSPVSSFIEDQENNFRKCPNDNKDLVFKEGCWSCPECGYGYCSVA